MGGTRLPGATGEAAWHLSNQRAWMETVQAAGGIAGVARSVEDAKALLAARPSWRVKCQP
jgi:hypothetical protein